MKINTGSTLLIIALTSALSFFGYNAHASTIDAYNTMLRNMEKLENRIDDAQQKHRKITKKIKQHQHSIRKNKQTDKRLDATINNHQKRLSIQLRQLQKLQHHSLLKRIADPNAYNQTQQYIQFIEQLPRLHINTLAVLTPLKEQKTQLNATLNEKIKQLKAKQKELNNVKTTLLAKKKKRKQEIQKKKKLLSTKRIAEYSRKKTEHQLTQKLSKTTLPKTFFSTKFRDYKGKLQWPIQGKPQKIKGSKNYAWEILNNPAEPVHSIAPGKVEYIGRLGILGKIIIINHGDNYRSIYKHLNSIQVAKGQTVSTQQIISQSGNTGGKERIGIAFELRHGRKSINFSKWLQSKAL